MDPGQVAEYIAAAPVRIESFREWLFHAAMGVPSAVVPFALDAPQDGFAAMLQAAIEAFAVGRELHREGAGEGPPCPTAIGQFVVDEFRCGDRDALAVDQGAAILSSLAMQQRGVPFAASWIGCDANFVMRALSERARQILTTGSWVPSSEDPDGPMRRWLQCSNALRGRFSPVHLPQVLACRKLFMELIEVLWGAASPFLAHLHARAAELPAPPAQEQNLQGTSPRA
jgi:hypothetical protein